MNPAFHSSWAALRVGVVLTACLSLPLILKWAGPPSREQAFSTLPTTVGPVSMIDKLIYDDSGPADVVFVGSSLIKTDVQARLLAQLLTEKLGRPLRVDILELNWYGADQQYFMLADYLARHPAPKLVVLHLPQIRAYENRPHPQAYRWLRYGDLPSIRQGFTVLSTLQMYGEMVLGAPRQLLSLLRPNLLGSEDPVPPAQAATGDTHDGQSLADSVRPATDSVPQAALVSPDDPEFQVAQPKLLSEYRFELGSYSLTFMNRMAALVKSSGATLALIHLPLGPDPVSDTILELRPWASMFGPEVKEIAIPKAELFQNLDASQFYYPGDLHMNPRGGERFTHAIAAPVAQALSNATASAPLQPSP